MVTSIRMLIFSVGVEGCQIQLENGDIITANVNISEVRLNNVCKLNLRIKFLSTEDDIMNSNFNDLCCRVHPQIIKTQVYVNRTALWRCVWKMIQAQM